MHIAEKSGYGSKKDEGDSELLRLLEKSAEYLIGQVGDTGYTQASAEYELYKPHWFRDTSFIANSLLKFSFFEYNKNAELAERSKNAADRIIDFNLKAIERYEQHIKRAIEIPYENQQEFNSMDSHIPARVGKDLSLYKNFNQLLMMDDSTSSNRWLIQYDTIPLILMSLHTEYKLFGLSAGKIAFLDKHAEIIAEYLGKVYQTPSANAWEVDYGYIHSYDISAIVKAHNILKEFSRNGIISISEEMLDNIFNTLYKHGGILGALRYMIADGVLYGRREPYKAVDTQVGVDSEEIFIFTRFGITDAELGYGVEEKTMQKINEELFSGNMLPIRSLRDTYFTGGRWLLLGLEYAIYEIGKGDIENAIKRIDYITSKYGDSMPEQEILNPANPGKDDGGFLALNGGKPIQKLNWSYAALIEAIIELEQAKEKKSLLRV
ncbi:MAG: glycoside hydrolase family 15 protein [Candidatus Micrarchaeia archaeon]